MALDRLSSLNLPMAPFRLPDRSLFDGPILPRLLQADACGSEGIQRYVETFGFTELGDWMYERLPESNDVWSESAGEYFEEHKAEWKQGSSLDEMFAVGFAAVASTDAFIKAWRSEATELRDAMAYATDPKNTIEQAVQYVLDIEHGWMPSVAIGLFDLAGSPTLVSRPNTVWDRAWLEAIDLLLTRGQRPAKCGWCESWFPPKRRGQKHCPGVDCADRALRHRWDRTDYRRGYQRMYARMRRGTMTRAEFEDWKTNNDPAIRQEGE